MIMPYYSQFMMKKINNYFYKRRRNTATHHHHHHHVHSFLGNLSDPPHAPDHLSKCGLGLIAACETPPPSPPPPPRVFINVKPAASKTKVDIGFIDEIGGGIDGLMSCTESLGFESCDERRFDDDDHDHDHGDDHHMIMDRLWRSKRSSGKKEKLIPPPISSLNRNGQPCFYLKPVRENGRLELTEVRIQRPDQILRPVRENGRLRLYLVNSTDHEICSKINEEEEENEQMTKPEEVQDLHDNFQQQEELQEVEEEEEEEEEEEKVEETWKYRGVKGEGFRRCHERLVMSHHHDHNSLHVWRQPCVTTR